MTISRRTAFLQLFVAGVVNALIARDNRAYATTDTYTYDATGRLTRVVYGNGATIEYAYDNAGNRTTLVQTPPSPPPPPPGFNATLQVTGAGPINLRALADVAGYNGTQSATVAFEVGAGVAINGASGNPNGGIGVDTGTWPTGSYSISLTLIVKNSGIVRGGGGRGGDGGSGASGPGGVGGAGGDAIYCRVPIAITVDSGGIVQGGGNGGAGGPGWEAPPNYTTLGGGGGGGGAPNGGGGQGGGAEVPGNPGGSGTASGGGGGGAGGTHEGTSASPGVSGGSYGNGYAIRKNGFTVSVTNNGTMTGTVA